MAACRLVAAAILAVCKASYALHMLLLLVGGIMVAVAHVPRRLSENRQPKNLPSIALPFLPETNVVPTMTRCVTSKKTYLTLK